MSDQELVFKGEFEMYRSKTSRKGWTSNENSDRCNGWRQCTKGNCLGAMKAVEAFPDIEITLVGNEAEIKQYLTK